MTKNKRKKNNASIAQKRAIRANYARVAGERKQPERHIKAPYPHFRYYKKSGHPALIVGEQPIDEYRYRKVMHGEKDGKRTNETVFPNPDPTDKEPMHIGKRVRHDKMENFEARPLPWKYPKK